jgi:AP-3 complex subunit delta
VKYVALLAFNKIVLTHPYLVAQQEDVILDCLDSADISIRLRAMDLVLDMVSAENLMSIVGRLMRQLRAPTAPPSVSEPSNRAASTVGVDPIADSDDETPEINIKSNGKRADQSPPLPDEYKIDVINRILDMCSANNYGNLVDFDWYIDILLQLVRNAPVFNSATLSRIEIPSSREIEVLDIAEKVGDELRNIAVRVKAVRANASRAAESIIMASYHGNASQTASAKGALRPVAWIAGEYASYLSSPEDVLTALLQIAGSSSRSECLAVFLQAIPKIFAFVTNNGRAVWTLEKKTMMSLLMARIIHTLEPLALHPDLEVQERAVEFSELLRLAAEASAGQEVSSDSTLQDTPLLLTQAIPSLFAGLELNSVAPGAQRNVPLPPALDLDQPISSVLSELLQAVDYTSIQEADHDEFEEFYHQQPPVTILAEAAINRLSIKSEEVAPSYQHGGGEGYIDPDIIARRRAERQERNKDDPFYIAGSDSPTDMPTPLDNIIQNGNDNDLDIDSIPIMQLDLGRTASALPEMMRPRMGPASSSRRLIQVAADETLTPSGTSTPRNDDSDVNLEGQARSRSTKSKNTVLLVDTSNIGAISLEGNSNSDPRFDIERQQREETEMATAMEEVEKLRLEMQRANERIQAAQGVPLEGTLVKKKTKKKSKLPSADGEDDATKGVKKKVKKSKREGEVAEDSEAASTVKRKNNTKKTKTDEGGNVDHSMSTRQ